MNDYLKGLNPQQYKAVTTTSQHTRVIAGAGSGKTRVLATRIVYIINDWGIDPEKILAITFTNKAANEMKTRIEGMLGGNSLGAHISTIHSFCVSFLRVEIRREGYPNNFTILDQDDQKSILKEAYKELNIDSKTIGYNNMLDYIGNCKGAGYDAEGALTKAYTDIEVKKAKVYEYYLNRCHELYALDFDDLLLWTNKILKKYPSVKEKWQDKYQFILVDEFQDIDDVQNELLTLLANPNTYIYVVGDPDQTIYSWRGANINIIMDFEKRFAKTETILLDQNYRSTKNILNGANSLIDCNKYRVKKDLFTDNDEGSKITHFTAGSEDGESGYIVSKINELIKKYEFKDIAILYRSNYLSRNIEKNLIDFKIPYMIYGGIRFYERAEIKDMLSYLRIISVKDDLAFKRVVNVPKRGIGNKTVENLFDLARSKKISLIDAVYQYEGNGKNKLVNFANSVNDWSTRSVNMSIEKTFQMLLEESGYREDLENGDDPKKEERLENIKELLNDIIQFELSYPEATLEEYLGSVALYTDIQSNNDGNTVSLMTIHAAKGLEFKNVFVIGMSETIFPSERAVNEGGIKAIEEERRLAYVAYTRARENLFLTDNVGYSYASGTGKSTSRFIKEIDEKFINHRGAGVVEEPIKETVQINPIANNSKLKNNFKKGELIMHDDFGQGVVINVELKQTGAFVKVAFDAPYGIKTLAMNFPKLHKI